MRECMSVLPHPWKALRELDTVAVSWREDLPHLVHAVTNGRSIIWMAKNFLQVGQRCTLPAARTDPPRVRRHTPPRRTHGGAGPTDHRAAIIPGCQLLRGWKATLSIEERADSQGGDTSCPPRLARQPVSRRTRHSRTTQGERHTARRQLQGSLVVHGKADHGDGHLVFDENGQAVPGSATCSTRISASLRLPWKRHGCPR